MLSGLVVADPKKLATYEGEFYSIIDTRSLILDIADFLDLPMFCIILFYVW